MIAEIDATDKKEISSMEDEKRSLVLESEKLQSKLTVSNRLPQTS